MISGTHVTPTAVNSSVAAARGRSRDTRHAVRVNCQHAYTANRRPAAERGANGMPEAAAASTASCTRPAAASEHPSSSASRIARPMVSSAAAAARARGHAVAWSAAAACAAMPTQIAAMRNARGTASRAWNTLHVGGGACEPPIKTNNCER